MANPPLKTDNESVKGKMLLSFLDLEAHRRQRMFPDETALSNLKDNERVVLYPSYAYPAPDQSGWILQVHGSVFEAVPENLPRKIMIRVLARLMGATQEQLETSVFKQRILGFTVYQHGGKEIAVKIGDKIYQLRGKTKKNGQFRGTVFIPNEDVDTIAMTVGATRHVRYAIHSKFDVATPLEGLVKLIDRDGVSVISDIDDTVKHTQVHTRKDMLANTFLHEFATVPGMVELYQKWQQQGASFHYVTSSPWQLFEPLSELFRDQGLPDGSFHMKSVRFRDPTVLQLFIARRWGKRKAIKQLLRTFPDRKFVMVGDSGEKDPETYGVMARKFPEQVVKIFIRDLGGKKSTDHRFAKAFRRVPEEKWQRFTCPSEISDYDMPAPAQLSRVEANGDTKS
ncbi:hypothetical protein Pan97_09700 [Bremerella volcania]|uniref:Phosphatidate phosphatase APP1 catalytic domain-containing protein n=1 Tax=Bremerella volcania TaxID=2527984 RepID=A0A518C407_9BACT|nr:phosphatase domain-containing protein [Bremerella volcania]QDU73970.1 hypothetical protein Pan97_09700 [Bremerella volcania]